MSKQFLNKDSYDSIKDFILSAKKDGYVIIYAFEGFRAFELKTLISQPIEGILYDIERTESGVLTMIGIEPDKWVNDYATIQVIAALKQQVDILKGELSNALNKYKTTPTPYNPEDDGC